VELSVSEAADRLQLDQSRIRQLVNAGDLPARRVGKVWLVDGDAVALMSRRVRPQGRPLSERRAWALLDLLAGGDAPWLTAPARSQVRTVIRRMQSLGADEWRAALRNRGHKVSIDGHPAAVRRLVQSPETVAAGPHEASVHGLDLVALSARPEVYLDDHAWAKLAGVLNLDLAAPSSASAVVRLVHGDGIVDRLRANERLLAVTIAADCLDDADPRANFAGLQLIKGEADRALGTWE
jgi:excisionase family DNA binding protein